MITQKMLDEAMEALSHHERQVANLHKAFAAQELGLEPGDRFYYRGDLVQLVRYTGRHPRNWNIEAVAVVHALTSKGTLSRKKGAEAGVIIRRGREGHLVGIRTHKQKKARSEDQA